jgi:alpha-beta hydrolase superfamily lysophospholipase
VTGARRVTGAVLTGAGLAWLAGCAVLHRRAFGAVGGAAGRGGDPVPADLGVLHEGLEVRTGDGLRLLAWHLPGTRPAVVVVSAGNRGRAGDVLEVGAAFQRAGFHVVVHGWRGTAGSDPAPHTLGVHEREDLRAVLDAVTRRLPGLPVGLLGFSLGGAVAIDVAATDPRVRAVCADSAFSDPWTVLGEGVRRVLRLPGPVLTAPVAALLALRTGARLRTFSPLRRVGGIAPRPLLLVHGEADLSVPAVHSRRLHRAAGASASLWLLPGVGHVGAFGDNRHEYLRRVGGFLEQSLGPAGPSSAADAAGPCR